MEPKTRKIISLLVALALFLSISTQDTPLWFEDPAFSKAKVYRRLTKSEIKEVIVSRIRWKYFTIRIAINLLKAAFFLSLSYLLWSIQSYGHLGELTLYGLVIYGIREEKPDPRVEVIIDGDEITFSCLVPFTVKVESDSDLNKIMVVFLSELLLLPAPKVRRNLSQKVIAECTDYSKTQVNTMLNRYREHGIEGLLRRPHGGLLSPEASDKVLEYLKDDLTLSAAAISRRLKSEGYTEATPEAVRNRLSRFDLNQLMPTLREKLNADGVSIDLFERLVALIEELLKGDLVPSSLLVEINEIKAYHKKESCKKGKKGNRQWDREKVWVRDEERRLEKERLLNSKKPLITCPNCSGTHVHIKENRERKCQDMYGKEKVNIVRYLCTECERSFTISPEGCEPYHRSVSLLMRYALSQIFKNVSLGQVELDDLAGNARVHKTTILHWIKRIADTMPRWYESYGSRTTGTVAIDEKWVKVRKRWHYVFIATDTTTLDILYIEIYKNRKKESAKAFLLGLRAMGFKIKTIITDGHSIYDEPIAEIYPKAEHKNCILHLGRNMRNDLMKVFGSYGDEDYKRLVPYLSALYAARSGKGFDRAWEKWSRAKSEFPEVEQFAVDLARKREEIKSRVIRSDIPRTTNSVERVIKEFERKYSQMENYMSLPFARAWCKLFQIYFRLHPFQSGRYAGKSPAEVMGYPVKGLKFTEYLLPRGEYKRDEKVA